MSSYATELRHKESSCHLLICCIAILLITPTIGIFATYNGFSRVEFFKQKRLTCGTELEGSWSASNFKWNLSSVQLEWQFSPSTPSCTLDRWEANDADHYLTLLQNKRILFVGDSLARNFYNSFIDVLLPDDCGTTPHNKTTLINGKIVNPAKVWGGCNTTRPGSWKSHHIDINAYNVTLNFMWMPWLNWQSMSNTPACKTLSNCTDIIRCANDEEHANWLLGYLKSQIDNDCIQLKSLLKRRKSQADYIVFNYPALVEKQDIDQTSFIKRSKLLFKDSDVPLFFITHYDNPAVESFSSVLESAGVTVLNYSKVILDEMKYDALHPAGPVQELAAQNLLIHLTNNLR